GEWEEIVDLHAVEIGQALVPVVRVLLHHPDLVLDAAFGPERAGAGDVGDLAEIVIILLKRLLAEDDVPAAGEGGHHEIDRPWRGELELDGVLVAGVDLADGGEQRRARDADAGGRFADAIEGGLDVFRREWGAVVEGHALTQVERV